MYSLCRQLLVCCEGCGKGFYADAICNKARHALVDVFLMLHAAYRKAYDTAKALGGDYKLMVDVFEKAKTRSAYRVV
jgi:hypothetical protein